MMLMLLRLMLRERTVTRSCVANDSEWRKKCGESKGQTRLRANGCEEEFKNKRRRVGGRK